MQESVTAPASARKKLLQLEDIKEVRAYLHRIGAEGRSLRTAVVAEQLGSGYWKDKRVIKFDANGSIKVDHNDERYLPTKEEAEAIAKAFGDIKWPELKLLTRLPKNLPDDLKKANKENIYELRNRAGQLVMIQLRQKSTTDFRGKAYFPWTYWDDDEWRQQEPDGPLPLWGMEHLKDNTTVFIHEGAKAARAMHRLINPQTRADRDALEKHPWGKELQAAAHLGWIGGAQSPHRTNFAELKKLGVTHAFIVTDNDNEGVQVVAEIARYLSMPCFHVQFTGEWNASFDLADPWPKEMFNEITDPESGKTSRHYTGPTFHSCLHPATWATDQWRSKPEQGQRGAPPLVTELRQVFAEQWSYCEEADLYVNNRFPHIRLGEKIFNKVVRPFSHAKNTADLVNKHYTGRRAKLCYRPDLNMRVVTSGGTSAINIHIPTEIQPVDGDPRPFLNFMEYLVPDPVERHHLMRWCATLIARPGVRMQWGPLMVGPQSAGKSMLGAMILAPLVGTDNCSAPSDSEIVDSNFNEWIAFKRLAVVHEIYQGHSWKAYNKLKSVMTDRHLTINPKFERKYHIDVFIHIYACSNYEEAIKLETDDRRWFYPQLTETPWPQENFDRYVEWLHSGGLSIIRHWAETFGDYVTESDKPPATPRKEELAEVSAGEHLAEALTVWRRMSFVDDTELPQPLQAALTMKEIVDHLRNHADSKMFESAVSVRRYMRKRGGAILWPTRIRFKGRDEYVIINQALAYACKDKGEKEANAIVRRALERREWNEKTDRGHWDDFKDVLQASAMIPERPPKSF